MKTRKILLVLMHIIAWVFLCAIVVGICLYTHFPKGTVKTTGTIVDNDYNNYLSGGNLVRIDDKLYYNYYRNDFAHGLVEISQSGSKRIHWEGWVFGGYEVLHRIRQHDGHLVMAYGNEFHMYSPNNGAFEVYSPLNSLPEMTLRYQTVEQKTVYRRANDLHDEEISKDNLSVYENGETKVITGPYVSSFYAVGDEIYYYDFDPYYLRTKELRKYNLTDGTDVSVGKLIDYHNISAFMIESNYLLFAADVPNPDNYITAVYKIDINSLYPKIDVVCTEDMVGQIHSFNAYDGKIFVSSDSGITVYDVTTNKSCKLYEKQTDACYIVDDTWVYFENDKAQLWRIAQIGGTAEKVFG